MLNMISNIDSCVTSSFKYWAARRARVLFALTLLIAPCQVVLAAGSVSRVVFYLDEHYNPVVRLDRVPQSEGVRAILALYALENGAGCEGTNEQGLVKCALTSALGLGENCSEAHIQLVRAWFANTPNLTSRWDEKRNANATKTVALEDLCYGQPDTASWQNIWEIIKMNVSSNIVTVDAIFFGGSNQGRTRARYVTSYRIGKHKIDELRSERKVLESSSKSIFEAN